MRPSVRPLCAVAVVIAAMFVAAGCVGTEPTFGDYGEVNPNNDGYYGTFMYGCTGVEATGAGDDPAGEYLPTEDTPELLAPPAFCTCVFEGLKERVPFAEMQALEQDQAAADPGEFTLPRNVNTVREDCSNLA